MSWEAGGVVLIVAFLVSAGATLGLIRLLQSRGVLDLPNERSSHTRPTPRGGGVGLLGGVAAGLLVGHWLGVPLLASPLIGGVLLVALASFADDYLGGVPLAVRAAAQVAAAALVVFQTGGFPRLPLPFPADFPLGDLGIPLAILWIVGVTNVYNFLDGIDGYAACQGVITGTATAFLFPEAAYAGLALAGACAGFLLFNWHPARIFLGDVGAASLGFLFAALPFQVGSERRGQAVFLSVICLWFFLSDGAFTLLRRLLRGEKVWKPHRSHLYQRLASTGLRHDQVVRAVCAAAALLAGLAVVSSFLDYAPFDWALLFVAVGFFLVYLLATSAREARHRASAGSP